jgi:hypothetical protein
LAEFQRGAERLSFSTIGNPHLSAENKISVTDIKYLKDKNWVLSTIKNHLWLTKIHPTPFFKKITKNYLTISSIDYNRAQARKQNKSL